MQTMTLTKFAGQFERAVKDGPVMVLLRDGGAAPAVTAMSLDRYERMVAAAEKMGRGQPGGQVAPIVDK